MGSLVFVCRAGPEMLRLTSQMLYVFIFISNEPQTIFLVAFPLPSCGRLAAGLLGLLKLRGSEDARVAVLGFKLVIRLCNSLCDHRWHNLRLLRGAEGFHTGTQWRKDFSALCIHTLPPSLCTNTCVCCADLEHTVVSLPCS